MTMPETRNLGHSDFGRSLESFQVRCQAAWFLFSGTGGVGVSLGGAWRRASIVGVSRGFPGLVVREFKGQSRINSKPKAQARKRPKPKLVADLTLA